MALPAGEVRAMVSLREVVKKKIIEGKIGLEDVPILLLCGLGSCMDRKR